MSELPLAAQASRASELALPTLVAPRAWALRVGRNLLLGVVLAYLCAVLLGPLFALGYEFARVGVSAAVRALLTPDALSALWMTIELTSIAACVNLVVGTLAAVALVRHRFALRPLLDALADLPLTISPVMVGLSFALLVGRGGWLGAPLAAAGIQVLFAFPGLVIATLFVTLPFTIREVGYVLEAIGTSEEEAAVTLGASPLQVFVRVTLPNIRVGLAYGLVQTIARSLGEFGAVLVLGGSISQKTQTATTYIHAAIEEREHAGAYGMATLLALLSIALWIALERLKQRKGATV